MKNLLYKMMEYRFIYRLMPKWEKFIYCFDVMIKNKSGSLHLGNGYSLNFESMTIEHEGSAVVEGEYWVAYKNGEYVSGTDRFGCITHTNDIKEALRIYDFKTAMSYYGLGYAISKE